MLVGIGALYRLSVRDARRGRWVLFTPGAVVATLGWIVVSVGFSFYTANFAHYSKTYGALATIVVLLLWLYLERARDPARCRGRRGHAVTSSSAISRFGAASR